MIAVGGITEFAAGNRSVIVRKENGEDKSYQIRLDDLLLDGDVSAQCAFAARRHHHHSGKLVLGFRKRSYRWFYL